MIDLVGIFHSGELLMDAPATLSLPGLGLKEKETELPLRHVSSLLLEDADNRPSFMASIGTGWPWGRPLPSLIQAYALVKHYYDFC